MLIGGAVGGKGGGVCCYVWQMTLRNRDRGLITGPIFALGLSCRCFRLPVSFLSRGLLHDMNGPIFANFDTDGGFRLKFCWCACVDSTLCRHGRMQMCRYFRYVPWYVPSGPISLRLSSRVPTGSTSFTKKKASQGGTELPVPTFRRSVCAWRLHAVVFAHSCRKQDLARWSSDQPRSRSASRSSPQWVL